MREFFPTPPSPSPPLFMTLWRHGLILSSLLITRRPRHLDTPLERERGGCKTVQKHLPRSDVRALGDSSLVPVFFVSRRRLPDVKIRLVSTVISEATSPLSPSPPTAGRGRGHGGFSFCRISYSDGAEFMACCDKANCLRTLIHGCGWALCEGGFTKRQF